MTRTRLIPCDPSEDGPLVIPKGGMAPRGGMTPTEGKSIDKGYIGEPEFTLLVKYKRWVCSGRVRQSNGRKGGGVHFIAISLKLTQ